MVKTIKLVDIARQDGPIQAQILKRIQGVIAQTAFINGGEVTILEQSFAAMTKAKYAIACSNGTDAIVIALKALGVTHGDEVITVPNTFIATTEAITAVGAKPVFVDIESDTYLMNHTLIEERITSRTKCIIPVNLYGQSVDIDSITAIARKHNLAVILDSAQAHLAEYRGRNISEFADFCTYSFFPGKNLGAYGDAGALTTNNKELADTAKMLSNHGRAKGDKYSHSIEGFNNRMDTLQAAVLNVKLPYLEQWTIQRRQVAEQYSVALKDIKQVSTPGILSDRKHVFHLFVIRAEQRESLLEYLLERGVQAGIHYPVPLHLQPAYSYLEHKKGDFPITESSAERIISLPMHPGLADEEIEYITDSIKEFYH